MECLIGTLVFIKTILIKKKYLVGLISNIIELVG